jgi:hypothetical protein
MTHTINVPLARQVLAQIEAVPARWTQDDWLRRPYAPEDQSADDTIENCDTTGCFAGWAVVLAGFKTRSLNRVIDVPDDLRGTIRGTFGWDLGPHMVDVQAVAAVQLGLNESQAYYLFQASNTYRGLYTYLERWTGGEIATPEVLPDWADLTADDLAERFGRDPNVEDDEDVIVDDDDPDLED